ncbi:hypothetical protein ACH3XW_38920 [Acanthocheilonema viteae]
MALDDDQKNWNKENIPINSDKATYCQISQNFMHEIRQEVTRQVLAELTIKNLDESDESDEREDSESQQNSDINRQLSLPFRRDDYFCDFQNGDEASTNGTRNEQAGTVSQQPAEDTSSEESVKSFCSDEDWTVSEKISRSIQSKWKPLQRCRRSKCNSNDFSENQEQTAISEDKKCVEEFITPPLCTIPGIELEYKLEECDPKALSKIILPKTSISSGLSREMQIQSEQLLE